MLPQTESRVPAPRIVATAQYIPFARSAHPTLTDVSSPLGQRPFDSVMQAVYGDTLRWRDECEPQRAPKAPSPPTLSDELAVAESNLSLSDMALCAARLLYDGASQLPRPDQIIVCSTSFEHDLALSCAGRLHHELASRRPPFAIGQLRDVSFATALDLTLAMMDADIELNTVLIVAAERWPPPFFSARSLTHAPRRWSRCRSRDTPSGTWLARARPNHLYAGHAQQLQRHRNACRFRHAHGRHQQGAGTSCLSGHTNGLDCPSEDG